MKCDTCGQEVDVHTGHEGTSSYIPVCEMERDDAVKQSKYWEKEFLRMRDENERLAAEVATMRDVVEAARALYDMRSRYGRNEFTYAYGDFCTAIERAARECLAKLKGAPDRITKHEPKKSWRGTLRDVDGREIQQLTTQADTYDQAFKQLLAQAQEIPRAFMVHLGLGQRLVKGAALASEEGK